jgi:hypothetical protein
MTASVTPLAKLAQPEESIAKISGDIIAITLGIQTNRLGIMFFSGNILIILQNSASIPSPAGRRLDEGL